MRYRPLRWPCRLPLVMEVSGQSVHAVLANIAGGGAMILGAGALRPGQAVVLHLPGGRRRAEVRWATADRCGVRFATPLAAAEVGVIRGCAGHGALNRHLRPAREMT